MFFNYFKGPPSSHSKNYIQMRENLKNMTFKKISFPTYLIPPVSRTISQVLQATFWISWFPENQPFFFILAINKRNDVMKTAIDFNVFVSKCSGKR